MYRLVGGLLEFPAFLNATRATGYDPPRCALRSSAAGGHRDWRAARPPAWLLRRSLKHGGRATTVALNEENHPRRQRGRIARAAREVCPPHLHRPSLQHGEGAETRPDPRHGYRGSRRPRGIRWPSLRCRKDCEWIV